MPSVRGLAVLAAVCAAVPSSAQTLCPPTPAALAVYADNRSADTSLELEVSGELADDTSACGGSSTYQATLSCVGYGLVPCGTIPALRSGTWINRLAVQVTGSATQSQTQRAVFVGGGGANTLVWTVYPRTFVVDSATQASLGAALAAAAARSDGALVTFSPTAFPGAASPQVIDLARKPCAPESPRAAAICFEGNDVVVDALDARGLPGGVVWSVGVRSISPLRLYGRGNVFRGLELRGSLTATPTSQADTVAIVGSLAQANRFEDSTIVGPTMGDAVGVSNGAGADEENVLERCALSGAKDKGLKVTTGAQVVVRRSCVHDNHNGGIQSTLGGHAIAIENLVQHNVPGRAGNGLAVTGTDPAQASTLVTDGNIVRFAGARGLSVVDAAEADFHNDYVADNQFAGAKIEALTATPAASFRGVALVCNHNAGISGACEPDPTEEGTPCQTDADCCGLAGTCCIKDPDCAAPVECNPISFPLGAGAMHVRAAEQADPSLWWGDATEAGRNAFTLNRNAPRGANFILNLTGATVSAEGNQWEHCGVDQSCDTAAVLAEDIRLAVGAAVAIGQPPGLRTETPSLTRVSPLRPGRDDLVRIFGTELNAIEGAACAGVTAPVAPCSADNARVRERNQQTNANRIRLLGSDGTILATLYPDAVTPTMLAFRMPFDCFMPLVVQVSKRDAIGGRLSDTLSLCDPAGCAGQPAGLPCDDGSTCTLDDRCTGGPAGFCAGTPRNCTGPCFTGSCDAGTGCVPRPVAAPCEDGSACTVDDRCTGAAVRLCIGTPRECGGPCLTGSCDPDSGCVPRPAGTPCDDGSACTLADHCSGDPAGVCSGTPLDCAGACLTGSCDPDSGCVPQPAATPCDDGSVCTLDDGCSGAGDTCVPGTTRACGVCSTGECDPLVGCLPKPAGTACRPTAGPCDIEERCDGLGADCPPDGYGAGTSCDDGNLCTQADRCEGSGPACTSGIPLACDDGNPCTEDVCLPERGCTHGARLGPCDDADPCTLDGCSAGRCVGVRLPPFAWESCQLATLAAAPLCPEGVPKTLGEIIATRVARAQALLQQAADTLEPRIQRRRLGAAARVLARLATRVQRAARRGRITPGCAAAIVDAVLVRQELVRRLGS